MKTTFISIIIALLIPFFSCKSKAQKEAQDHMDSIEKMMKENSPESTDGKQQSTGASTVIPADMQNLLGEWTLVRRLRDDNGNGIIDGEEEKTAIPDVKNYLKFNADGTCKFETLMDGKYKIVTAEDGRKKIVIHDLNGTEYPFDLYIVSVTENELVINSVYGGSGLEVFKRP